MYVDMTVLLHVFIQELKDEGQSDIDKRDQCKDEFKNSASVIKETKWMIEKNDAKIAKLDGLIQLRTEQKMKTIEEINELMAQLAQMKADREAENEAFTLKHTINNKHQTHTH